MEIKKPTPEEKLFAVIQGAPHAPLRPRAQALSLALARRSLAAFIGPLELPRINRLLAVVVAVLGAACLLAPLIMQPQVERVMNRASTQSVPFVIAKPLEGVKPLADYSELMREKDPFQVGSATPAGQPTASTNPQPRPQQFQDALADLKLVGISWGDDPTVMIEELSTHETHFLKTGQSVGPFTVKEILQDRVMLRAGEQDVELF